AADGAALLHERRGTDVQADCQAGLSLFTTELAVFPASQRVWSRAAAAFGRAKGPLDLSLFRPHPAFFDSRYRRLRFRRRRSALLDRLGLGAGLGDHIVTGLRETLQREIQRIVLPVVGGDIDLALRTGLGKAFHQRIVHRHLDIAAVAVATAILQ